MSVTSDLSERELEILVLVATGASNKQIAQQLSISTNTVKVHLRNIFSKIEVSSRTEAAMYAVNAGLLPVEAGTFPPVEGSSSVIPLDGGSGQPSDGLPFQGEQGQPAARSGRRLQWTLWLAAAGLLLLLAALLVWRGLPWISTTAELAPDATAEASRWKSLPPMPTPRFGLAVAGIGSQIFAIGGDNSSAVSDVVEIYDTNNGVWSSGLHKPLPVADVNAGVIGGRIYVPGGRLETGRLTEVLEIYDPRQNTWSQGSPLPVALSAYALVTFEGKLYLFGGWDGAKVVATVYEYDPDRDVWTGKTSMKIPRRFAGAAVASGLVYLMGGESSDGKAMENNDVYQPALDDGKSTPWSAASALPEGRLGMGITSIADIIYLAGGIGNQDGDAPALIYFPDENKWLSFVTPQANLGRQPGFESIGATMYLMGGESGGVALSSFRSYQAIYTVSIPLIIK